MNVPLKAIVGWNIVALQNAAAPLVPEPTTVGYFETQYLPWWARLIGIKPLVEYRHETVPFIVRFMNGLKLENDMLTVEVTFMAAAKNDHATYFERAVVTIPAVIPQI